MPHYLSKNESLAILKKNYVGRLGYIALDSPFIVPITYNYVEGENCILALSSAGHKIDNMRKNNKVCLYVDEIDTIKVWKSILVHGVFEEIAALDQEFYIKKVGADLQELLKKRERKPTKLMEEFSNMKFPNNEVVVYRIKIWDITGRYME